MSQANFLTLLRHAHYVRCAQDIIIMASETVDLCSKRVGSISFWINTCRVRERPSRHFSTFLIDRNVAKHKQI